MADDEGAAAPMEDDNIFNEDVDEAMDVSSEVKRQASLPDIACVSRHAFALPLLAGRERGPR